MDFLAGDSLSGYAQLAIPASETKWMRGVFVVAPTSRSLASKWFDIIAREVAIDPCLCCPDGGYSEYEVTLRERGSGGGSSNAGGERLCARFARIIRRGGDMARLSSHSLEDGVDDDEPPPAGAAAVERVAAALRFVPNALRCGVDAQALIERFFTVNVSAAPALSALFDDCAVVVGTMEITGVVESLCFTPMRTTEPRHRRPRAAAPPTEAGEEAGGSSEIDASGEGGASGEPSSAKRRRVGGGADSTRYIDVGGGWMKRAPRTGSLASAAAKAEQV
tara:strand:- start:491 stop:1324 length:834 start_codon:yes stop_codon:yes gene_type:complete